MDNLEGVPQVRAAVQSYLRRREADTTSEGSTEQPQRRPLGSEMCQQGAFGLCSAHASAVGIGHALQGKYELWIDPPDLLVIGVDDNLPLPWRAFVVLLLNSFCGNGKLGHSP